MLISVKVCTLKVKFKSPEYIVNQQPLLCPAIVLYKFYMFDFYKFFVHLRD